MKLQFEKCRDVKSPQRGTPGSAGIDFFVPNQGSIEGSAGYFLRPGESANIPSGIISNIPKDHALVGFNKSGIAIKKGLIVGAGVIDSDYEGELHLHVINVSDKPVSIDYGDKLVQFLLVKTDHCDIEIVDKIQRDGSSERGLGKFGSTGEK